MAFMKRMVLFFAVNILVVTAISFLLHLFNVQPYLTKNGLDINSLATFCFIWGMAGSFISLLLSKTMAKWMMGVQIIDPETRDPAMRALVESVHDLAKKAGLSKMPEVGIYSSAEINAFATGPSRSNSLVAVSTGLLNRLNKEETDGVIGHEIAHIANGDMVTMTLLQGIVNAFVMFLARVLAFVISRSLQSKERENQGSSFVYHMTVMVLEMALMIFGQIVVAKFSRSREFRADAASARLGGKDKMIKALVALKNNKNISNKNQPEAFQALQISGKPSKFLSLFATHPPLDERIKRLQTYA
ncbi:MAG TPA: protease HtpX [Parachlamydiaceae bacterium]|nr:protease HtpX [Parachlamydiaceae bacterium]